MRIDIERRCVNVGSRRVTYGVTGAGSPLVLVHGLSGSVRWWRPIVPSLAARYTVYVVNLPGFGAFMPSRPRVAVGEMAEWLRLWMEEVHLQEVDLVGHSMGGYIALTLAVTAPELVRHLVLVDAAGLRAEHGVLRHSVLLLREIRSMRRSFLPVLVADAVRAGPVTILRAAAELLQQDLRPYLGAARVPTLLVWGERDALVPRSTGEILHHEIAHSRLVVISGAGHVPMYDNPAAVAEAILSFLEEKDCGG